MKRIPVEFEQALTVACMAVLVSIARLDVVTCGLTDPSFARTEERWQRS